MPFELALRLTELLLACVLVQQCLEHLWLHPQERLIHLTRLGLAVALGLAGGLGWGLVSGTAGVGLLVLSLFHLNRFRGPYNGGADRMTLLALCCITAANLAPTPYWKEVFFGYLAVQLVLSYALSGGVKLLNPDWRSGRALSDVFAFSAYPVSEDLRQFASSPRLLFAVSWSVILFELIFPLALLNAYALYGALVLAAFFHLANAVMLGLNRFFWAWLTCYPSVLWLQSRVDSLIHITAL